MSDRSREDHGDRFSQSAGWIGFIPKPEADSVTEAAKDKKAPPRSPESFPEGTVY
jgi:hypothetical protein